MYTAATHRLNELQHTGFPYNEIVGGTGSNIIDLFQKTIIGLPFVVGTGAIEI